MDIKCPHCGEEYIAEANEYGKFVKCETCGEGFIIGTSATKELGKAVQNIKNAANDSNTACGQEPDVCNLLGIHNDTKQSLSSDSFWNLSGRATRSEYWTFVAPVLIGLFFITIAIAIGIVKSAIDNKDPGWGPLLIFTVVCVLVCKLLTFPITVRRLHDRNMSGWFLLAFLIIPFGEWAKFIIVGCLNGTVGPNEFGPDPKDRRSIQQQLQQLIDAVTIGCQPRIAGRSSVEVAET